MSAKPYRGKYPSRVHIVWSAKVDGKHVMRIRLNDGRVFDVAPRAATAPMPEPGMSLETVLETSTAVPFVPRCPYCAARENEACKRPADSNGRCARGVR